MKPLGKPFVFEDRTGQFAPIDFNDIYNRMFFRVVLHSASPNQMTILLYDQARRRSGRILMHEHYHPPAVVLELTKGNGIGNIAFEWTPTIPIKDFLRRTGILSR